MARARSWVLAMALAAAPAHAAPPLRVSADVAFDATVRVAVHVENTGAREARDVSPEVRHRLLERTGAAVTLAPGGRHTWHVEFPLPGGPRGDALIVLVRWRDEDGSPRSLPWARSVDTPGLMPTEAQVIMDAEGAAGLERAGVRITNATGTPLRARLVALLPAGFFTTPTAQPVEVPPRQTVRVPITVQSHGAPGESYPVYGVLEFEQGGIPRVVVASTTLTVGGGTAGGTLRPLTVGAGALALAVAITLLANRRAARRGRRAD